MRRIRPARKGLTLQGLEATVETNGGSMCNKYESQAEEQSAGQRGVFRTVTLKRGANTAGMSPVALLRRTMLADVEDGVATLREHLPRPAGRVVSATQSHVTVMLDPDPLEVVRADHTALRLEIRALNIRANAAEAKLSSALDREKALEAKLHGWVLPPAPSGAVALQAEITRLRREAIGLADTAARAFNDGQEEAKKQIRRVLGVLDKI